MSAGLEGRAARTRIPPPPADDGTEAGFRFVTVVIAHVSVFVAGTDLKVVNGATAGLILAIGLLPVWLPTLRRYRSARVIVALCAIAIPSGLFLAEFSSADHQIDASKRTGSILLLLSGLAAMVLILWAREHLSPNRVILLFGLGSLVDALLFGSGSWKFDFAVPVTLVVLGILEHFRSHLIPAAAVFGLGVVGVLDEGRSLFGFCLIAATLTVWQMRTASGTGRTSRWFPAALLAGMGLSIYFMVSSLLTGGAFGAVLQQRSEAQIDATGSLIAGGRPEWAATRELMQLNPAGFGLGVVPSWADLEAGRSGLASINIDAGGYVNNYMFGGEFNLHSITADLWVNYGWVGLTLAAVIVAALVRNMSFLIASRRATTSIILTSVMALWFMFFGPIYSNWLDVCLALGVGLMARTSAEPAAAEPR